MKKKHSLSLSKFFHLLESDKSIAEIRANYPWLGKDDLQEIWRLAAREFENVEFFTVNETVEVK